MVCSLSCSMFPKVNFLFSPTLTSFSFCLILNRQNFLRIKMVKHIKFQLCLKVWIAVQQTDKACYNILFIGVKCRQLI